MKTKHLLLSAALFAAIALAQPATAQIPPRTGTGFTNPVTLRGFNPQPEPPAAAAVHQNPAAHRGFDPQPDPPGSTMTGPQPEPPTTIRGFNPQPEPPALDGLLLPAVQK